MALPIILAGVQAALTIGGAVADHVGKNREAKAAEASIQQSLRLQRRDLSIRSVEEKQAAGQGRTLAERQAMGALGATRASAASAGVRGDSVDALSAEIEGDLARTFQSIDFNLVASLDQIDRVRAGAEANAQSQINSLERPSLMRTMLRAGGGALDAFSTYQRFQKPLGSDVGQPSVPSPIPPRVGARLAPIRPRKISTNPITI
jgi:hypothetical protein